MQKKWLLVKYNKVTNDAFNQLSQCLKDPIWTDLVVFGSVMDHLSYSVIDAHFQELMPFDVMCIGDIFWGTGQNICRWCQDNDVTCCFLQHGQWKYIKNKKSPMHLPDYTFVYGDNVVNMVKQWPYSRRSQVIATGNPRYDAAQRILGGKYVYFCPPVVRELVPNGTSKFSNSNLQLLQSLKGIDQDVDLVLHPHYREGAIDFMRNTFPGAKFADPELEPLPLVAKASHVITHRDSTTVLDAIACGKPSVLLNFVGSSFFPKGYFEEFAIECDTSYECKKALMQSVLIEYTDYVNRARPYIYLGNASARIAALLV